MKLTDKKHVHKFEETTEKVMLRKDGKRISGYDILQQRKCVCGKLETYDLERTIA